MAVYSEVFEPDTETHTKISLIISFYRGIGMLGSPVSCALINKYGARAG